MATKREKGESVKRKLTISFYHCMTNTKLIDDRYVSGVFELPNICWLSRFYTVSSISTVFAVFARLRFLQKLIFWLLCSFQKLIFCFLCLYRMVYILANFVPKTGIFGIYLEQKSESERNRNKNKSFLCHDGVGFYIWEGGRAAVRMRGHGYSVPTNARMLHLVFICRHSMISCC